MQQLGRVPAITLGIWLLCRLLTSALSPPQLPVTALSVASIRSQWMMRFLCAKALVYQSLTGIHRSLVKQISPDKNMDCSALLHHLRWPLDHMVSLSCANSPSAYVSYDVLVHQLADLLAASSRLSLTI